MSINFGNSVKYSSTIAIQIFISGFNRDPQIIFGSYIS